MAEPTDLLRFASDYPVNAVLRDYTDGTSGLRYLVVRGPLSFCAYVGVPADHTLCSLEELDFECHYGITFQQWGAAGTPWPEGWYWWGWSYSHNTDWIDWEALLSPGTPKQFQLQVLKMAKALNGLGGKKPHNWTLAEVTEDALDALSALAEQLAQSQAFASLLLSTQSATARAIIGSEDSPGQQTKEKPP